MEIVALVQRVNRLGEFREASYADPAAATVTKEQGISIADKWDWIVVMRDFGVAKRDRAVAVRCQSAVNRTMIAS